MINLVTCPHCRCTVRQDRLEKHFRKVHFSLSVTPPTVASSLSKGELIVNPCSCLGSNENCFKCGGCGYVDKIGEGRSSPPIVGSFGKSNSKPSSAKRRKKTAKAKQLTKPSAVSTESTRQRVTGGFKTQAKTRIASMSTGGFIKDAVSNNERKMDGSRDYYLAYRESGRFGSHPSHDAYDDESSA